MNDDDHYAGLFVGLIIVLGMIVYLNLRLFGLW